MSAGLICSHPKSRDQPYARQRIMITERSDGREATLGILPIPYATYASTLAVANQTMRTFLQESHLSAYSARSSHFVGGIAGVGTFPLSHTASQPVSSTRAGA